VSAASHHQAGSEASHHLPSAGGSLRAGQIRSRFLFLNAHATVQKITAIMLRFAAQLVNYGQMSYKAALGHYVFSRKVSTPTNLPVNVVSDQGVSAEATISFNWRCLLGDL
jgi:hypothetical protein